MRGATRKRLGDLLTEAGVISNEQLDYALKNKNNDEKLGDFLIQENFITEQQLIEVLEFQLGIPHINLNQYAIEPELLQLVPAELAKRTNIMPIRRDKNKLFIAMADPMDYFAIEEVRMATGCQIETSIAAKDDLYRTITKYYDLQESMEAALSDLGVTPNETQPEITDEDSPIVRLVNQIIANGVAQRASDIHFDPQETDFRVRYRVDGNLRTERSLPKHMQSMITARIKILGNLNITENRVPQDGRIKSTVNFKPVDIRLSTLPTVYGEKIVMRILDLSNAMNDISKIGFTKNNEELFRKMIARPNGIVLITGPTGSGKSSTLYAALNNLNEEGVNIITVEDPVEYQLEGVNQIQVKDEVGLTFAAGLRSILRQDPDIVMIGEIRDLETAEIAVRASLTGHLVLSTLHTNSAVESIARLKDMGIEPFLISSSLNGVMAQRLVRRVCRDCARTVTATDREKEIFSEAGFTVESVQRGRGCPACSNTGYRGRLAIHELLPIDREIKDLILQNSSISAIRDYMKQQGYPSLLEDGLQKVLDGVTTTEEVLRVATFDSGSEIMSKYSIKALLQKAFDEKASDLHITVGIPPVYRINGRLQQDGQDLIEPEDVNEMVKEILPEHKTEEYEEKGETDFNYSLEDLCRFRVNAYHQRNVSAIAFRLIPSKIPTIESLGMPKVLYDLAEKPQGLILVTGPTGSGKSTTLAAMLNYINETKSKHIITLEDPIEYLHDHKQSVINQREIGIDTQDFASGLRASLRQDPDVILVGEMRDLETISTAITAAETGHLVFATLHTSSAPTTIDRIIDVFPPHQQGQIRIQLANVLQGIISQRLFVRKDSSGRIAATEIMVAVPSVTNLIRNEKVHQIPSVMQTSRALGMHTLQTSLQELVSRGNVSLEEARPYLNAGEYI